MIIGDHEWKEMNRVLDEAQRLSGENPSLPTRVYRMPWGSYGIRFEHIAQTEIEGRPAELIATYLDGCLVKEQAIVGNLATA